VGGDPQSSGVAAACCYEARKFGIHSAMASSTAYKLCPDAVFIRPRFDAYRAVSSDIREIFCEYTDLVEPNRIRKSNCRETTFSEDINDTDSQMLRQVILNFGEKPFLGDRREKETMKNTIKRLDMRMNILLT
jgi:DNA polymerase-4